MDEYKAKPRVTIGSILEDKTIFPNGFPYEQYGLRKPISEEEVKQTINKVAENIAVRNKAIHDV